MTQIKVKQIKSKPTKGIIKHVVYKIRSGTITHSYKHVVFL